jgi:Flp pilus assembly protein TadG
LKRFSNASGSVAIIFSLSLPLVVGGAGLGAEVSYWYYKKLQLQAEADAAAYAGGIEKRSGSSSDAVRASAKTVAISNGFLADIGTIAVNSPPLSGPNQNSNSVEVIVQEPVERFFSIVFTDAEMTESARAVATFQSSADACILALDPTVSKAILFSGNSGLTLKNCVLMANSVAGDAIKEQGSAIINVSCLISVGGVELTSAATLTDCTAPVTQAPPAGDPFADLPVPVDAGNCRNDNGAILQPGNYCNGMSLGGTVTLKPGTYIVSGGDFRVNANANITGSDVTIYLTGDARVSINGNATVNLSAPTSGTYSGILFFGDRSNSTATNNTFNGTAQSHLTGALYFASQPVQYLGDFSGQGGCTQIVADTVLWSGNTSISQDCSAYGMKGIPAVQLVKLVE